MKFTPAGKLPYAIPRFGLTVLATPALAGSSTGVAREAQRIRRQYPDLCRAIVESQPERREEIAQKFARLSRSHLVFDVGYDYLNVGRAIVAQCMSESLNRFVMTPMGPAFPSGEGRFRARMPAGIPTIQGIVVTRATPYQQDVGGSYRTDGGTVVTSSSEDIYQAQARELHAIMQRLGIWEGDCRLVSEAHPSETLARAYAITDDVLGRMNPLLLDLVRGGSPVFVERGPVSALEFAIRGRDSYWQRTFVVNVRRAAAEHMAALCGYRLPVKMRPSPLKRFAMGLREA